MVQDPENQDFPRSTRPLRKQLGARLAKAGPVFRRPDMKVRHGLRGGCQRLRDVREKSALFRGFESRNQVAGSEVGVRKGDTSEAK